MLWFSSALASWAVPFVFLVHSKQLSLWALMNKTPVLLVRLAGMHSAHSESW